jgi:DNA-binding transcriptional regulator YiaG
VLEVKNGNGKAKRNRSKRKPAAAAMTPDACRRIREDTLKMTQEQFAKQLGVAPLTINFWENGKTPISKSRALAIQALVSRGAL